MTDAWRETPEAEEAKEPEIAGTEEETDRKCPDCGGTMDFDPATGGLLCPYCGHTEQIASGQTGAEELDFAQAEETGNCNWGAEKKVVICKSCGAETIYDALAISSECPYCGSNQVMEAKGKDTLAPGGVCPFRMDRKQAGSRFRDWIRRKWFCPGEAKEKAKPEAFQGVYLPAWTFDSQTVSSYQARYGIDHTVRRDGKTHTETRWYHTSGTYREFIDDQVVFGSDRYDGWLLNKILPFDTAHNLTYKPEYVAGFAAERYTVGLKSAWEKAKAAIRERLEYGVTEKVRRENRADAVSGVQLQPRFTNVTYKYLLLPVWISSFTYRGKVYHFMVNGQTGKVGGKTPVSPFRVALAAGGVLLFLLLVYFLSNYVL